MPTDSPQLEQVAFSLRETIRGNINATRTVFRETAKKWATNRSLTETAFNIKTTQDMLGLTCRDFSLLFTGTPQLLEPTTIFNSCLIGLELLMRVMHIYHEWTMPPPPTEHSGLSPHMPKHPFMLTTKKSRFCIYLDFFLTGSYFPWTFIVQFW